MKKSKEIKKQLLEILAVVIAAILFRSCVYELYYIPSESMLPNLIIGDRIVINKYTYGISKYSFPLSPPLFNGRILDFNSPQRGDVIVFEKGPMIYIKRLIGLPGDRIQVLDGKLYINGDVVPKKYNGKFTNKNQSSKEYIHSLPNKKDYTVLDDGDTILDYTGEYIVPEDHYFFMGDNMDHSNDSRNPKGISYVKLENILGRAEYILYSSEYPVYDPIKFVENFRTDRLLKKIK